MDQQMRCRDQQRLFDTKRGHHSLSLSKAASEKDRYRLLCACRNVCSRLGRLLAGMPALSFPTKNGATPQTACNLPAPRVSHASFPNRLDKGRGDYEGFTMSEQTSVPDSQPENDYRHYSPSAPYCIIDEFSLCRLDYYKVPSCVQYLKKIVAIDPGRLCLRLERHAARRHQRHRFSPSNPPPGWLFGRRL